MASDGWGSVSAEEQEKRATSALLAVMRAVPELGHALVSVEGSHQHVHRDPGEGPGDCSSATRKRRVNSRYRGPRPYDLRHTAASLLLRDPSYSLPEMATFLGHDIATLSAHHAHVIAELYGQPPASVSEAIFDARRRRAGGQTPPNGPQLRGAGR